MTKIDISELRKTKREKREVVCKDRRGFWSMVLMKLHDQYKGFNCTRARAEFVRILMEHVPANKRTEIDIIQRLDSYIYERKGGE